MGIRSGRIKNPIETRNLKSGGEQFFRFNQSGQNMYYLSAYRRCLCGHIPARFTGTRQRQNIKLYSVGTSGCTKRARSTAGAFE